MAFFSGSSAAAARGLQSGACGSFLLRRFEARIKTTQDRELVCLGALAMCVCTMRCSLPTVAAALLLICMHALHASAAASSSAATLLSEAECDKMFTRGVELYELGLQVRHFLYVNSWRTSHLFISRSEITPNPQSNDPEQFEAAVKVQLYSRSLRCILINYLLRYSWMWALLARMSTFQTCSRLHHRESFNAVDVLMCCVRLSAAFDAVGRYGMLSYSNAGTLLEQFNQYQQVRAVVARGSCCFDCKNHFWVAGHRVFYWSH
jgi:hypothetical protein